MKKKLHRGNVDRLWNYWHENWCKYRPREETCQGVVSHRITHKSDDYSDKRSIAIGFPRVDILPSVMKRRKSFNSFSIERTHLFLFNGQFDEDLLQFLIDIIDAELFETVSFKDFKSVDIQQTQGEFTASSSFTCTVNRLNEKEE